MVLIFCEDVKSHAQVVSTTTTTILSKKKKMRREREAVACKRGRFLVYRKAVSGAREREEFDVVVHIREYLTWSYASCLQKSRDSNLGHNVNV